jgi:hypothetical protein
MPARPLSPPVRLPGPCHLPACLSGLLHAHLPDRCQWSACPTAAHPPAYRGPPACLPQPTRLPTAAHPPAYRGPPACLPRHTRLPTAAHPPSCLAVAARVPIGPPPQDCPLGRRRKIAHWATASRGRQLSLWPRRNCLAVIISPVTVVRRSH